DGESPSKNGNRSRISSVPRLTVKSSSELNCGENVEDSMWIPARPIRGRVAEPEAPPSEPPLSEGPPPAESESVHAASNPIPPIAAPDPIKVRRCTTSSLRVRSRRAPCGGPPASHGC